MTLLFWTITGGVLITVGLYNYMNRNYNSYAVIQRNITEGKMDNETIKKQIIEAYRKGYLTTNQRNLLNCQLIEY